MAKHLGVEQKGVEVDQPHAPVVEVALEGGSLYRVVARVVESGLVVTFVDASAVTLECLQKLVAREY